MDIDLIVSAAVAMKENDITLLEWTDGETSLKLERGVASIPVAPSPAVIYSSLPQQGAAVPKEFSAELEASDNEAENAVDFNNIIEIKSPMVGVFYDAPAPDSDPFVKIGSRIKKGDVLCIIEAMKLMNEITAECDGEIVDICAANGQVVEFSQVLFKIF